MYPQPIILSSHSYIYVVKELTMPKINPEYQRLVAILGNRVPLPELQITCEIDLPGIRNQQTLYNSIKNLKEEVKEEVISYRLEVPITQLRQVKKYYPYAPTSLVAEVLGIAPETVYWLAVDHNIDKLDTAVTVEGPRKSPFADATAKSVYRELVNLGKSRGVTLASVGRSK